MDASHEFFHPPGDDEYWSESHYLDGVGESLQVNCRLGFYPNRDEVSVFAFLIAGKTVYGMCDHEIDPAHAHGTAVDAPGLRIDLEPLEVGRDWRVRIAGEATRAESPAAVLAGEGPAVPIEAEFVTRARHEPFLYSRGADWTGDPGEDRYEVATRVQGEARLGEAAAPIAFDGPGERDHSWGTREWTGAEWLWISGSFDDGTAYNHLSAWRPGEGPPAESPVVTNGFWFDGETVHPLTDADVEPSPAFSVETARRWLEGDQLPTIEMTLSWDGGSTDIAVEPVATSPVGWKDEEAGQHAVLKRSPSVQSRDGAVDGRGFLENMTQLPLE